ncbi:hypothetical protein CL633_02415 [bacterium]|nr:hypothetical protein [bacterium]|tara:strand:- start:5032 stop:5811 length:780 start_codon:yes stop_codon:yes gene_type:complete
MNNLTISVILTSYNQREILIRNIEAWIWVYENQFKDFEIIVADDGSDDGTIEALEKLDTPFELKLHTHPHGKDRGCAKSKNIGIDIADGDYIFVFDGDTLPGKDTLPPFLKLLPTEDCLMGLRYRFDFDKFKLHPYSPSWIEECITRKDFRAKVGDIPPLPMQYFSGANIIFPAKQLKRIKWAPDDWEGFGFDDYMCALHWLVKGHKFKMVKESVAFHIEHPNTMWSAELKDRYMREVKNLETIIKQQHNGWFKRDENS